MARTSHQKTSGLLNRFPLFQTGDLDEARSCVAQKFCDHRLEQLGRCRTLAVTHNHVAGREVSLNYLHYGADVQIDPGLLRSFYLLQIPLSGHSNVIHRGEEVLSDASIATLLNPDRETQMTWQGECRKLILQISKSHLQAVAESLSGAPLPGPVRFDTRVDLRSANGIRLKRIVQACAAATDRGDLSLGDGNGTDLKVEMDLAQALLTLQRSNISHILDKADTGPTPRALRLAVEYIHANLAEPITLNDIATVAGVNVRTLQKGFRQRYDLTPMQYLRNARLDAAHYQLIVRQNEPSVTQAAFGNGFSHLGRFSRDYKRRFGVLPSQRAT
ncbi:AraC family transcriptional regulator [Ruegeria sp. SCPT10]|uniref:AraC family transcriptional regulator n=1 Tax=Ruegeria sp. SCP10 TaxID=3141377 RepID=UPI003334F929